MELLLDVISVVPREDHTLLLVFENQVERLFDMTPYLSKKLLILRHTQYNIRDTNQFPQCRVCPQSLQKAYFTCLRHLMDGSISS